MSDLSMAEWRKGFQFKDPDAVEPTRLSRLRALPRRLQAARKGRSLEETQPNDERPLSFHEVGAPEEVIVSDQKRKSAAFISDALVRSRALSTRLPAWLNGGKALLNRLPAFWKPPLRLALTAVVCIVAVGALAFPASWPAVPPARIVPPEVAALPARSATPAVTVPSVGEWIAIVKPIEIFSLEAPELAKAAKLYAATRHRPGGGRRDSLALGLLASPEPALRLSLYRRGQEAYVAPPLFADLARQAAEAGLSITHSGLADVLSTRFGQFEIIAVTLDRALTKPIATASTPPPDADVQDRPLPNTPAARKALLSHAKKKDIVQARIAPASLTGACSGFRLIVDQPALTVTGLACGGQTAVITKQRLGCLLDRLDLTSGGGDRPLVDFFATSELRRDKDCGGMRLGPDAAHAAWLDDRPATPQKIVRHH